MYPPSQIVVSIRTSLSPIAGMVIVITVSSIHLPSAIAEAKCTWKVPPESGKITTGLRSDPTCPIPKSHSYSSQG